MVKQLLWLPFSILCSTVKHCNSLMHGTILDTLKVSTILCVAMLTLYHLPEFINVPAVSIQGCNPLH